MKQLLLLPSAHSAVLVTGKAGLVDYFTKAMPALFVAGLLVSLLGGLDLISRASLPSVPDSVLQTAFAPAVTLIR